jgi:hypothetical protein
MGNKPYYTPWAFLAQFKKVDEMAKLVRNTIRTQQVEGFDMTNDLDLVLFSIAPSFMTLMYSKMKAHGNHFRVDNDENNLLVTFDTSVAFIFQQSQGSEDDILGTIQYVGALKEIL